MEEGRGERGGRGDEKLKQELCHLTCTSAIFFFFFGGGLYSNCSTIDCNGTGKIYLACFVIFFVHAIIFVSYSQFLLLFLYFLLLFFTLFFFLPYLFSFSFFYYRLLFPFSLYPPNLFFLFLFTSSFPISLFSQNIHEGNEVCRVNSLKPKVPTDGFSESGACGDLSRVLTCAVCRALSSPTD